MSAVITRLVCSGCGAEALPDDPLPFRCPNSPLSHWTDGQEVKGPHAIPLSPRGEGSGARGLPQDTDHVLHRELVPEIPPNDWRHLFLDDEPNPFVRYRALLHSYNVAIARGMSDDDYVDIVRSIDVAIESIAGTGFRETPFGDQPELNAAIGRDDGCLWIKDETNNVSGSHKARHLTGILLWLEVARRTSLLDDEAGKGQLAIASCGNAALAAAVVAKAAGQSLAVFIPPDAHPNVVRQLTDLGATLVVCPREGSTSGDPCMHRFHESVAGGAMPFGVQGNENGLTLEGGLTLGYEIVSSLLRTGSSIDRLFIQVGGGALASSSIQAFHDASRLGIIERVPTLHAVQTRGAYPLWRAWHRAARMTLDDAKPDERGEATPSVEEDATLAASISGPRMESRRRNALHYAATHRSEFMWAWESVPHSVAHGIIDDETYDWLAIVEGMIETGGFPIVVSEDDLRATNDVGRSTTGIDVDHTGSAGLAGALALVRAGLVGDDESIVALFTGRRR